ncbi:hypothetical protein [Streptomyces sp. CA-132043]|uniref:hypothetical protein n=1 Tax=Streptomyces sp. CA-132043 TaxID=3240048 RepID=UPI003D9456D5
MRHRIVRVVSWVRDLLSRPAQTPPAPPRTHRPSVPAVASSPPRPLDEYIDGDASRLVRPYLVVCERLARERAARLFADDGQFSVYAVSAA